MQAKNKSKPQQTTELDEELCLIGATGLADFISFVKRRRVDGRSLSEMQIAEQWRKAAKVYDKLKASEAGAADHPKVLALPSKTQAHVDKLILQDNFAQAFSTVPIAFGMVPLDQLVVYQSHITRSTVRKLTEFLGAEPSNNKLAQLCLPIDATKAQAELVREARDSYVFQSDSHDFRFLGAKLLAPKQISNLQLHGHPSAILALSVGFSSNVLNVIRYANRLVLNNGYHRVYAMRALGITHAPCVIQVCAHAEDLSLAANTQIHDDSDIYFNSPRPPLLKDYFNLALTTKMNTHKQLRQIQLKFSVDNLRLNSLNA